ncbi:MAG: transcriptional repressor [Calditrichaeota bacterium]|nr:MAG: transcriptional repressor [Calditrichota bacterium]
MERVMEKKPRDSEMNRLDEFINELRQKGLNVTYQRLLIFKHLMKTKNHPTAEEIYREVIQEYPSLSMATVYKILETLTQHNLIAKVNPLHGEARYDGDPRPHHHLVCVSCKKIVDVPENGLNHLPLPEVANFKVMGYRVQFEGLCDECAGKTEPERPALDTEVTFCGKAPEEVKRPN